MIKSDFSRQVFKFVFCFLLLISIVSMMALIIFQAKSEAIDIKTFHMNGVYQTASGLFRIDSGNFPGKDFFPYLGVGPLLIIYPFFKLAGGVLTSSVFAAKVVTLTLSWISVSVLWHLIIRPRFVFTSLCGGAILLITTYLVAGMLDYRFLSIFGAAPGNSLRPIRSVIPYIVAIAIYFVMTYYRNGYKSNIFVGIVIAISLLWSNDFAIPTAACSFVFYSAILYFNQNKNWKRGVLVVFFSAFISWASCLFLITLGHPFELLKYNFVDVAKDQWWYFAPYSETRRIFGFVQLFKLISGETIFPLFVLFVSSFFAIKSKRFEYITVVFVGVTLFLGGCLASIGGHLDKYFEPFYFWGQIVLTLSLMKGIVLLYHIRFSPSQYRQQTNFIITGVFSSIFLSLAAKNVYINYKDLDNSAKNDVNRFYVAELGGYLGSEWRDYIEFARKNKNKITIEEYWGIFGALNRTFSPWPVDSVIHALGNVRNVARRSLDRAEFVVTTRYATSPMWQPWSISQNYWLYDRLLSNWTPFLFSPKTVVWKRGKSILKMENVKCNISETGNMFSLGSSKEGLYRIDLDYSSNGSGRYLIMAQNNISDGYDAKGYVSLPPSSAHVVFPVFITRYTGNLFKVKVVGNENVDLTLNSCVAQKIPFENEDVIRALPKKRLD